LLLVYRPQLFYPAAIVLFHLIVVSLEQLLLFFGPIIGKVVPSPGPFLQNIVAQFYFATVKKRPKRILDAIGRNNWFSISRNEGRTSMKTLSPVVFGFVCVPWK